MNGESPDIPYSMRKVHRRLERWRSSHTTRLPIPDRLWAAAAELAARGKSPDFGVSISRIICKKILQSPRTVIEC